MNLKKILFGGAIIAALTLLVNISFSSENQEANITTQNIEALALGGLIDWGVIPTPDPNGYCRCKFQGCYAGNMISARPNCGKYVSGPMMGQCHPHTNCFGVAD